MSQTVQIRKAREYFERRPCTGISWSTFDTSVLEDMKRMAEQKENFNARKASSIRKGVLELKSNFQKAEWEYCNNLAIDLIASYVQNW